MGRGVHLSPCVRAKQEPPKETGGEAGEQEAGQESIPKEGLRATEARQARGTGAKLAVAELQAERACSVTRQKASEVHLP